MRLDLFLKASRLSPRRSVAQKLCDAGLVLLNGSAAKAAHVVKAGDKITIRKRDKESVVRVISVPSGRQIARKDAAALYELISETFHSD